MPRPTKYAPGAQVGDWHLITYRASIYADKKRCLKPAAWLCQCTCGILRWVQASNIYNGSSTSCGHASKRGGDRAHKNVRPPNSIFAMGEFLHAQEKHP